MTLTKLLEEKGINPNSIEKIYHGKDHWCRCGCGGRYFYSTCSEDSNGYKRSVNFLNSEEKFNKNVRVNEIEFYLDSYCKWVNIPVGDEEDNKCYCVYLNN